MIHFNLLIHVGSSITNEIAKQIYSDFINYEGDANQYNWLAHLTIMEKLYHDGHIAIYLIKFITFYVESHIYTMTYYIILLKIGYKR